MWQVKLIIVGLLLMTIGNAYAWDSEAGYEEGEYVNVEFTDGSGYIDHKNNAAPVWISQPLMLIIKIVRFFIGGGSDNEITVAVETTGLTWNNTADAYEEDGTNWAYETDLILNANVTNTDNIKLDPVTEYFKNNTEKIEDFETVNAAEHPDILNVSVSINGGGVDISDYGYVGVTDEGIQGIEEGITNPDYGFDTQGRGSGGSSGSIYESINMYGSSGGDTTGMGAAFYTIFWCIIPLVFILSVMKLSSRCLK
jgi:hypothetical protein